MSHVLSWGGDDIQLAYDPNPNNHLDPQNLSCIPFQDSAHAKEDSLGQQMASIPLPMLTALLCLAVAAVMLRLDLGRRASGRFFAALFVVFAIEAVLVGLRFGYGVTRMIPLQGMLPLFVGPLMYLGFAALACEGPALRRAAALHFGAAVAVNLAVALPFVSLSAKDAAIMGSYVFYLIVLIRLWRRGPDHLIHARLDIAPHITRWMFSAAGLLALILLMDSLIALNFAVGQGSRAATMISFGSVVLIAVLLITLASLPTLMAARPVPRAKPVSTAPDSDSAAVVEAAQALLTRTQLYLDPDLSVQRVARRLQLPERKLSAAINQVEGINVSQFVNGFRLAHAADLLRGTDDSVARIMAQSGFLTRSNFYREFTRVYGMSPAQYRTSNTTET